MINGNCILRMPVETADEEESVRGWVTRTAEAANGPVYFRCLAKFVMMLVFHPNTQLIGSLS